MDWLLERAMAFRSAVELARPLPEPTHDLSAIAGPDRCPKCGAPKDKGCQTPECHRCRPKKRVRGCALDGCPRAARKNGVCREHRNRVGDVPLDL